MSCRRAFATIELFVVLFILIVGAAILIIAFWPARRAARSMQPSSPVRGIHQSMVLFAQGNNHWYPGLDSHGNGNPTIEDRYQTLLDGHFLPGNYPVSPVETKPAWQPGSRVTSDNYSYAMLELNPGAALDHTAPLAEGRPHARRKEWRDTINTEAPVLSDRNTGTAAAPQSIHTPGSPGDWRGSIAYNDNHVVFETRHILPKTIYSTVENTNDNLFEATGGNDALMIFSGIGE